VASRPFGRTGRSTPRIDRGAAKGGSALRLGNDEYMALAQFRHFLREFLYFSAQHARRFGVTPSQYELLLAIRGAGKRDWLSVTEIAKELKIRRHSAAGLVERAVRTGLVTKETDPEDARRVRVRLGERGEALLAAMSAAHARDLERIMQGLGRMGRPAGPGGD
jgi:DNA-binding MarR family transcriptional regulator